MGKHQGSTRSPFLAIKWACYVWTSAPPSGEGQPGDAGFGQWGYETDQYHRARRGRTRIDVAAISHVFTLKHVAEKLGEHDDPIAFIETVLCDPETGEPFVLLDAERNFLRLAFNLDERGRLLYPELLYSCPKKSGKTAFGAIIALTLIWLFGGAYPEAVLCANDLDQAQGQVFAAVRRIVECSPLLRREAQITQNKITFPSTGATIIAIGSDYAGAAGANQNIAIFDEAWAYTSERSRRLWDEMVPPQCHRQGNR